MSVELSKNSHETEKLPRGNNIREFIFLMNNSETMIFENKTKQYNFHCELCDYHCRHRGDWNKHIMTLKHKRNSNVSDSNGMNCVCGKRFVRKSSYTRHIAVCSSYVQNKNEKQRNGKSDEQILTTMKDLVAQNSRLVETICESHEIIKDMAPKMQTVIHNHGPKTCNIINNGINMNVFLNEHCKDALNLTAFVESLKLSLHDLDETRQRGLAHSLGNIFLRGLRELELHKRPIHCSNAEQAIMYIRDNDAWDLDTMETHLRTAIGNVSCKQIKQIREWERHNPKWHETDKGKQIYAEMVRSVMTGFEPSEKTNLENSVIRTIAKETLVNEMA